MIVGLGIDLVELDRIEHSLERHGRRFLERVLTPFELEHTPGKVARNAVAYVAARFAAKEAAAKALGTGFSQGVWLSTIEVRPLPSGKPELVLYEGALLVFKNLGATHAHLSLTHGRDTAAAVVVLET
jgi:holo-[acyl-carrier protein] synthase